MAIVEQILVGTIQPLGSRAAPSAIAKRPIKGRLMLGPEGFIDDQQADRRNHGGPDKAVHHYAFDHYAEWIAAIGPHALLEQPGGFGENLTTSGMTERSVALGDIFRLGQAIIQVSQGRQPCWKLNARFAVPDMAIRVQTTGMSGWYYRVLQPGLVEAGDELILQERISPEWTIHRLWHVLYVDMMNIDELRGMAALEHLPAGWRNYAQKRLESRKVEDWSRRLNGDA